MNFNKHSTLEGQHAFLGASKYHWINYDDEKIATAYANHLATLKGTQLHEFAAQCIRLGQKLPRSEKTLNMYVNDAIGFKMIPEQILVYSDNCFGTADAILFRNNFLITLLKDILYFPFRSCINTIPCQLILRI